MSDKEYMVSAGNSNTGPVGFVAYTRAGSPEEALEKIQAATPDYMEVPFGYMPGPGVDMVVYFNEEALTVEDIEESEE